MALCCSNNRRRLLRGVLLLPLACACPTPRRALAGGPAHTTYEETVVFGTRVAVTIANTPPPQAQAAVREVFARFAVMHEQFHPWREGGELQRLNARIAAGELPAQVSAEMAQMIAQAQVFSAHSEGVFNPGVGALVRLWGFHQQTGAAPDPFPTAAQVEALVQSGVDIAALRLQGRRVLAAPRTLQLDFGAQAKGIGLDVARAILLQHGIDNALIDIGGNIMALGMPGRRAWRVGLTPQRGQPPLAQVNLYDGEAVATSGGSVRSFHHQGREYSHILDPRTGYPAAGHHAAAVIAGGENAGAVSDAAATALVLADAALARRMLPRYGVHMAWRFGTPPTAAMRRRLRASGTADSAWQ